MRSKLATLSCFICLASIPASAAATLIRTELVRAPYKAYESSCARDKASRPTYFRLRADFNFDGTEDLIIGNTSTCENQRCKADVYLRLNDRYYGRIESTIYKLSLDPKRAWLRQYGDARGQLILGRPSSGPQPIFDIWFVDKHHWQFRTAVVDYNDLPESMKASNPGEQRLLSAEYSHCKRGKLRWSPGDANPPSQQ